MRASGGGGVASDTRPPAIASRTTAASSLIALTGRHSSSPSCQTSESSVTAPVAALRRSSVMRTGPTGTPLIATYHSSAAWSSSISSAASSSFWTDLLNAEDSPVSGRVCAERGGREPTGRAEAKLVASALPVGLGGAGLAAGPRGAAGACPAAAGFSSRGMSTETLVSVTAARTSIMCPHLRHFIRTVLPATFSSAIWYFALH
jgi:hypothetical protein